MQGYDAILYLSGSQLTCFFFHADLVARYVLLHRSRCRHGCWPRLCPESLEFCHQLLDYWPTCHQPCHGRLPHETVMVPCSAELLWPALRPVQRQHVRFCKSTLPDFTRTVCPIIRLTRLANRTRSTTRVCARRAPLPISPTSARPCPRSSVRNGVLTAPTLTPTTLLE